jgi:hypothetical protein
MSDSPYNEFRLRITKRIDKCAESIANHDCEVQCNACFGAAYIAKLLTEILRESNSMHIFSVGDRVRNIRPRPNAELRCGEPNILPPATVIEVMPRGTIWIKYDDDVDDLGWPERADELEKLCTEVNV